MKENLQDDILMDREMHRYGLDLFGHDRGNIFDNPINELIKNIKAKFQNSCSEYDRLEKQYKNDRHKFSKSGEEIDVEEHNLQMQIFYHFEDRRYLEDELFSLFEMKIIYAFKHLEISIKQLLSIGYKTDSITKYYKWDTIGQFLNTKNINFKDLNCYEEVNQLRNLNNSLKHSDGVIDDSIKNIQEFKGKVSFSFKELEDFYERIKALPNRFFIALKSQIFKDIYTFNEDRIFEIAKSFALRMNKDDALKFSNQLLTLYK